MSAPTRVPVGGHDLRLVPAAVLTWVAAWWGTGSSAGAVQDAAVTVLALSGAIASVLCAVLLRAGYRARGTPAPAGGRAGDGGRPGAPGRAGAPLGGGVVARRAGRGSGLGGVLRGVLVTAVLLGACTGAVLAHAASALERWSGTAVQDLASRRGTAVVELVVAGDPVTGRGAATWQQEQLRVRVDLVQVGTGPDAVTVQVPALLRADPSWWDARWGERRRAVVRLSPARPGDAYAVLADVTGPSTVLAAPRWQWRAAERLRAGLREASAAGTTGPVGDGAALLPGLVVGDTRLQGDDLVADLRTAGLSHLTAVSGANVTLVCGGVLLLVVLLRGGRRLGAVLAGVALVGLVVVARPEPSVLRAAVMGSVGLLGVLVGRRGGGTSALSAAVVVVLLLDPWLARAPGFHLSVLATAALVLFTVPWSRALGRVLPRTAALALAVPAAAQLAVTPALVRLEPVLSLYALPANVLAAPAVAPATLVGLLAALLSLVDGRLAAAVAVPARWAAAWIARVGRTVADLPGAAVPVPEGLLGAVVAGGSALAALLLSVAVLRALPDRRPAGDAWAPWPSLRQATSPGPRPPDPAGGRQAVARAGPPGRGGPTGLREAAARRPALVALVASLVALAVPVLLVHGWAPRAGTAWPGTGWAVVVCDVGQGESVLVRAGRSSAVVVDAGPEPARVESCLRRAGVTSVPLLVLTHLHADHVGGLDGVAAVAPVQRVWTAPGGMPAGAEAAVVGWAQQHGALLDRPVAGTAVQVGGTRVDVLSAGGAGSGEGDAQDVNDAGLVLRLDVAGLVLLAVGDIGAQAQQRVLADVGPAALRADVTTVAHHGSADQLPAFYAAVGATVAVASAGRDNAYGHPTDRARDVVAATGARVLTTTAHGDVALRPVTADGTPAPGAAGGAGGVGGAGGAGGAHPAGPGAVTVAVRTTRRGGRRAGAGWACPPPVPA